VNELLNTNLTAELSDSLGGFIFSQLGRVPLQGDTIQMEDWNFTVEEIRGQRIGKIRARRQPASQEKEKEDGNRITSETH
jgi:CBS domain containing-hemolysin-like protein